MTEALKQIQQAQLRAAENGISFMVIADGKSIQASVISRESSHYFSLEKGYCEKTINNVIDRINQLA